MILNTQRVAKNLSSQTPLLSAVFAMAIVALAALGPGAMAQSSLPELNCTAPSQIEAVICADPELPAQHRAIVKLSAAVGINALGSGPSEYTILHRNWLESRDKCVNREPVRGCLIYSYFFELKTLASSALFTASDIALPLLREFDPKAAPIYEALYRYASIADDAERIKVVEPLVAPLFDEVSHQFQSSFMFKDVPTAHDAVATEGNFAIFVAVAALVDRRIIVPCIAINRRPGLIAILNARYGSSIDAGLPNSDCDAMLPVLPAFLKLATEARRASTACQGGTIRFAFGRDLTATIVAVRLHLSAAWEPPVNPRIRLEPSGDEVQFRREHERWLSDAVLELTNYYASQFKADAGTARHDAESAVDATLRSGLPRCGG